MRLFDTVSLKYFCAVCKEENIAHAAAKQATVPSAVSKRISAMEQTIGTPLLQRGSRGVKPTPAGMVLWRYANEILELMAQMDKELSTFADDVRGKVRVCGPFSPVMELLSKDIGNFMRQYPHVQVEIIEKVTTEIVTSVETGDADIGVCWEAADLDKLQCRPYRHDDLELLVPRSHPLASRDVVTAGDIVDYDVVDIFPGSLVSNRLGQEASKLGKIYNCRVQVSSIENACRIVADQLGITVIPRGVLPSYEGLVTIPVGDAWAHRLFMICAKDFAKLALPTRLLVDSLSASVAHAEQDHQATEA
ncbi:LysR family transcriptional regulator [Pelobacter seleniigenes]|uniref:LysR family transcriptional regulator n=1 Tax=Pelobacter seleniigenes TaxID=407188 RepID=UPI00068FC7F2|nr:LysR family transcriptional regulator [Pelobacter seleniigenes]